MGLFSSLTGKHECAYKFSVSGCPWSDFDHVARPFFNTCKSHGMQLASEPQGLGGIWSFNFNDGSSGTIMLGQGYCEVGIFRTFTKDDYASEPAYRENVRQIYDATISELYQSFGNFHFIGKIMDNGKAVEGNWNIPNVNTSYM